ncbi:MAG: hypothetical protein MRK02_12415 [Candidatus Scalindua sp.]|nr:hypothetical protein [Candidatus Scalindua sp.]
MDKNILISRLAKITANLSPSEQGNTYLLKRLRSELAAWLKQNQGAIAFEATGDSDLDEQTLSTGLKKELSEIVNDSLLTSRESAQDIRIVKRYVSSEINLGELVPPTWNQGQQPAYSLGPFLDEYGKFLWFDFYKPLQLRFASYKGESVPFLKFEWTSLLPTGIQPEINLRPGSIWIRANYLNSLAPANSYAGLKLESGQIRFSEEFSFSGGNIVINATTACRLSLTLSTPQMAISSNIRAGRDASESFAILPREVFIQFTFRNGIFEHVSDSHFRLYGNEYHGLYHDEPVTYEEKLQRIAVPLSTSSDELSIHQVHSTLFLPSEQAKVQRIFWALPLTIDDHNKLGEASGSGGFLLKTDAGLKADCMNVQNGPIALHNTGWIVEPGKIELHAFKANAMSSHQRFYLWWEDRVEKKSSVSIDFLKDVYIKYVCSAIEEIESIGMDVDLKGHFDKPLTTDGRRIKATYTHVQYSLGQYKEDRFLQCVSSQNLQKKVALKQFDELKPLSLALSNAFARISPCDEFILAGRVTDNGSLDRGFCSFQFGLYAFIPIFPDPYVSNIQLNVERERGRFLEEQFNGLLQTMVTWTDIADPQLSFRFRSLAGALFSKIEPQRGNIYQKLKDKNSRKRISHILKTTDEQGRVKEIEVKASDIIGEDEDNDSALKNHFEDFSGGSPYPDLYVLDVSGNVDQFGIGLSNRAIEGNSYDHTFKFEGIECVSPARNLHVITLPPVQWEAVKTIQNPDVQPYPFPSPAHSLDTGDPAVLSQVPSYHLIPVTPQAAIQNLITSFREVNFQENQRSTALINLPFGMKSLIRLEQFFTMGTWSRNAKIEYNQPHFKKDELTGGTQISLSAISLDTTSSETPGFTGATIQTRNLVDKNNDVLGLSVLGFAVDTVFNNEFKIGGNNPRVPLKRIDISGYGASTFSNWRNPDAQIAATSQAQFDVIVGRTSHEVVQVRSILYCCGASLVRTITIQRTAGGGITRHDSGWVAEGPGLFDFSYRLKGKTQKEPNPYTFHLGSVKGYYHITNIRDTLRVIEIPPLEAGDDTAQLQEVIYDADILIEDVSRGQTNGFVPSKGQKGFVQLKPSGRPLSASQLAYLLMKEGSIGGPVDCLINVARSGQEMRGVRVDTNRRFGSTVFVNAVRGSLVLPREGAWSIMYSKNNDVEPVQSNSGLALVRYNASPSKYEFSEPADNPKNKFGLMHSSSSHRTLFLKPYIIKNDPVIVTEQPQFADLYSLVNSNSIFPAIAETFPVGVGDGKLKVHGSGVLELTSSGKMNIMPKPRMLHADADFKSYIEYFDKNNNPSEGAIMINPADPEKWKTSINAFKLVYDIGQHSHVKMFHLTHYASGTQRPKLEKPLLEFGSFLKPVGDMLRFMDTTDLGEFDMDPSNNASEKNFHYKYKISYAVKIEFETHKTPPFHETKLVFYPKRHKEEAPEKDRIVIYKGLPALLPPLSYFKGKFALELYEDSKKGKSSISIKLGADMGVLVTTILEAIGVYAVGIVEYKAVFGGSLFKEQSFKIALGCAVKINLVKLAEVEAMRSIGIEYESESKEVNAVLIQKAEIGVATCSIGVTIEAKAPTKKIVEAVDPEKPLVTLNKILAAFELTLAIELTAAYVVNFEYEYTWKEIVPII